MPKKAVNIRMDIDLLAYLQARAEKEHRSLSNMIVAILLKERGRDNGLEKRKSN